MIDPESERKFLEAVAKGATILCAQDVYDELQRVGYSGHVELCKYLSPGSIAAVDREGSLELIMESK